jgi:hypothetical protein
LDRKIPFQYRGKPSISDEGLKMVLFCRSRTQLNKLMGWDHHRTQCRKKGRAINKKVEKL